MIALHQDFIPNCLVAKDLPQTPEKRDLSLAINEHEDEILINKHTASIFIGTDFERMVRNARITTVAFTGKVTELGVESSARDALNRLLSCHSFRCSIIIR